MTNDVIDKLISASLLEATNQNIAITVSIVDLGGHLIALRRMDGCSFFGIDVSQKKAVTSSQLKTPTHVLADITQKVPALQKAFDKNLSVLTIPGGFPITLHGQVIGGLGISGGDFNQDKTVGEKAIQSLSADEKA